VKISEQRVGVLVDVANMYYSAKNIHGSRVNFGKILEDAVGERQLVRALAYVIKADSPDEQKFFDALDKQGFELKMKDLQVFAGGAKKGDWDVGITVDAIKLADRLDTIVLVAGDGDCHDAFHVRGNASRHEQSDAAGETGGAVFRDELSQENATGGGSGLKHRRNGRGGLRVARASGSLVSASSPKRTSRRSPGAELLLKGLRS